MKAYVFLLKDYPSIVLGPVPPNKVGSTHGYFYPSGRNDVGNFGIVRSKEPEMFRYLKANYPIPLDDQSYVEIEI